MTYAVDTVRPGIQLREWFKATKEAAVERRSQRGAYLRTLHALQSMSDRDLADIGISRLSIRDIAIDAAYGNQR